METCFIHFVKHFGLFVDEALTT